MRGAHLLVCCLDPGILWESPKGASVHLRSMVHAFESLGARVTVVTHEGLSPPTDGDRLFTKPTDVVNVDDYFRTDRSRSAYELRAVAANPLMLHHLARIHQTTPFDAVYERLSLWSDVGARLAERLKLPLVVEVNAPLRDEQRQYRRLALDEVVESMERRTLGRADRVTMVSRSLRDYLADRGVSPAEMVHLPNIAEKSRFRGPQYVAPSAGEEIRLGFSGSLKPWHGLEAFLPTFAEGHRRHPNLRLEILGDGKGRRDLELAAERLGVESAVRFLGHLPHAEVAGVMHRWHLVVAPYRSIPDFYFSPLKIAEALAAGRPVLTSCVGELPEMVGEAGRLVEPDSDHDWLRAIDAIAHEPSRLGEMAAAAERMTAGWTWRTHAERSMADLVPGTGRERAVGSF